MNVNKSGLKTLDKLGADSRVCEIYRDSDGIWLYTAPGFAAEQGGSHTIHEDTAKAVLAQSTLICPCDCDACKDGSLL